MKILFELFIFSASFLLTCMHADAIEMAELSLMPSKTCQKPPKAPPHMLMHMSYKAYETVSNDPFDDTIDINGDGWCDWISIAAGQSHSNDIDNPKIGDFIFLGTKTGWKRFANIEKHGINRSDSVNLPDWLTPATHGYLINATSPGWLAPDMPASNFFIFPTIIYSKKGEIPYLAVLGSLDYIVPAKLSDIGVYQWDNTVDMPRGVSDKDRKIVIQFLQVKFCDSIKIYTPIASIICDR